MVSIWKSSRAVQLSKPSLSAIRRPISVKLGHSVLSICTKRVCRTIVCSNRHGPHICLRHLMLQPWSSREETIQFDTTRTLPGTVEFSFLSFLRHEADCAGRMDVPQLPCPSRQKNLCRSVGIKDAGATRALAPHTHTRTSSLARSVGWHQIGRWVGAGVVWATIHVVSTCPLLSAAPAHPTLSKLASADSKWCCMVPLSPFSSNLTFHCLSALPCVPKSH